MSERDDIEDTALPAVLLRRSDLPVPSTHPARSFFGGLPRLPPNVEWPTAEVRFDEALETVALTFVGQIDLAELPGSELSPLPKRGTLFYFCSSMFVGEGQPPCRVIYCPVDGHAHPDRAPPADLMPLAGEGGDYQVKWLDPNLDFHSRVEFKYPLSFRLFRDFDFQESVVGGKLMIKELCRVLGPGEPRGKDWPRDRDRSKYLKDENWPFNWLLITYVVRSVLSHVQNDLKPKRSGSPVAEDAAVALKRIRASAIGWLERCQALTPMGDVDPNTKAMFRSWWFDVLQAYDGMKGRVGTYGGEIVDDLNHAIDHTIRVMAESDDALDEAPRSYVVHLERQNRWMAPTVRDAQYRRFGTAVHQILGYGSGPQDATEEHLEDMLLLQIQGDPAFFNWHSNTGCALHFWIDRDALERRDFSQVVATFESD